MTSNSEYEAGVTRNWFACEPTIVYSGAPEDTPEPVAPDTTAPMILLSGTYDAGNLARFIDAVATWAAARSSDPRPVFAYAGGYGELVRQHASRLSPTCEVPVLGYLPIADMLALCRAGNCPRPYASKSTVARN